MDAGSSRFYAWHGKTKRPVNFDFKDILAEFNAHNVEFIRRRRPRARRSWMCSSDEDLDVWVRPDRENAVRVIQSIAVVSSAPTRCHGRRFCRAWNKFSIGLPPLRIDTLTEISGLAFGEAWPNRMLTNFDDEPAAVL